jgi:hypothetical protein
MKKFDLKRPDWLPDVFAVWKYHNEVYDFTYDL